MNDASLFLVPAMKETLVAPTINNMEQVLLDISEIGLDAIIDEGVLKDIPVLRTIAAVCKTGINIRERNLIRQTAVFIRQFEKGNIKPLELENYKKRMQSSPKETEREIERVLLCLYQSIDTYKTRVLGAFYVGYINQIINWDRFCELSDANSRMFIHDYEMLYKYARRNLYSDEPISNDTHYQVARLVSIGLMIENKEPRITDDGLMEFFRTQGSFFLSSLGNDFYALMPKDEFEK